MDRGAGDAAKADEPSASIETVHYALTHTKVDTCSYCKLNPSIGVPVMK